MDRSAASEPNPFLIGPRGGPNPRLETLLAQLASSRHYLLNAARDLKARELDSIAPGCPNTIGSLLAHVAAAEAMFRNITCHGRQFAEHEEELKRAFQFANNWLAGSDYEGYREELRRSHQETVSLLSRKGDAWLDTPTTFMGRPSNYHYYWTHLLMDEARHTGQAILIRKHLMPGHDPEFQPYAVA